MKHGKTIITKWGERMRLRNEKIKRSNKLNLVKVGILLVLTLGLYSIYLFYNNLL